MQRFLFLLIACLLNTSETFAQDLTGKIYSGGPYYIKFLKNGCAARSSSFMSPTNNDEPTDCSFTRKDSIVTLKLSFRIAAYYSSEANQMIPNNHGWYPKEKMLPGPSAGHYVNRDAGGAILDFFTMFGNGTCSWKDYETCSYIEASPGFFYYTVSRSMSLNLKQDGQMYETATENDYTILPETEFPNKTENEPGRSLLMDAFGEVRALAISPDGKTIASGHATEVSQIHLWNRDGSLHTTLLGHRRGVSALGFSADGKILFSKGFDDDVKLWDLQTRRMIMGLPGARLMAWFYQDRLVTVESSGRIETWTSSGKLLTSAQAQGLRQKAWNGCGKGPRFALLDEKFGTALLFDIQGNSIAEFKPEKWRLDLCEISPDGNTIAFGNGADVSVYKTSQSETPIGRLKADGQAYSFDFSDDGQRLLIGGAGSMALVSSQNVSVQKIRKVKNLYSSNQTISSILSFDREKRVVTGHVDGSIRIYELP